MSDHAVTGGLVVRPVRFTDDVPAMRAFLETLGLAPRVEADFGGWVDMVAGGGMVALHDAASSNTGGVPGQTRLSFEADDIDALAARLKDAGTTDVTVYDENYGRVLTAVDPLGDTVVVDERSGDLYGYRLHDLDQAAPTSRVVPVRFTDQRQEYDAFLRGLGLTGEPTEGYAVYAASGGAHGFVGVHHVYAETLPIVPTPGAAACHLTFTSTVDLARLRERCESAGHTGLELIRSRFGSFLRVIDPDGQEIQVHGDNHK